MRPLVVLTLLLVALPAAAARDRNLDAWIDSDVIPMLREQLVEHPRFKGETVMFVILDDNAPASVSNELALSLRDRLLDAALHTPGVVLGWQQGNSTTDQPQTLDCTRDDVHYYIGVDVARNLDGSYRASVRALDLQDRNWVTGFGSRWRGKLTPLQRSAIARTTTDRTFLGTRDVPFSAEQTDLLAARLAHEMSCALSRDLSGDYLVTALKHDDHTAALANTTELVSNNLASNLTLEFTADEAGSNAVLSGKAHRIDGKLYQYWLTITPRDADSELSSLSASAYITLPDSPRVARTTVTPVPEPTAPIVMARNTSDALLGPLRVVHGQNTRGCRGCSLITSYARDNAVVFLLQHQANYGLVRLADSACRRRTLAHIVTSSMPVQLPIPYRPMGRTSSRETEEWLVTPTADTYYAIAVADERVARRLANHLDKLPQRCTSAAKLGLKDVSLERWLDEFATLTARSSQHVDWRALEVRDVL